MGQYLGLACLLIVWTLGCLWAGKRWGNKLSDEAYAELIELRSRLASRIAGGSNPYRGSGGNVGGNVMNQKT